MRSCSRSSARWTGKPIPRYDRAAFPVPGISPEGEEPPPLNTMVVEKTVDEQAGPLVPREGSRISSVDALRGLTIFLMVFVNDLGPGAPSWMHHIQPPDADGMTLADIVFPFFLFIVGVSIPLAQERAEWAGLSRWSRLGHILVRTAALLLMGAIELNSDS